MAPIVSIFTLCSRDVSIRIGLLKVIFVFKQLDVIVVVKSTINFFVLAFSFIFKCLNCINCLKIFFTFRFPNHQSKFHLYFTHLRNPKLI